MVEHDPVLDQLGALAERYFKSDPSTTLVKPRQLARRTAAHFGVHVADGDSFADTLNRLRRDLDRRVLDLFHELRVAGSDAVRDIGGDPRKALACLRLARELAVWFHRAFAKRDFKAGPLVPPPDPEQETAKITGQAPRPQQLIRRYKNEAHPAERGQLALTTLIASSWQRRSRASWCSRLRATSPQPFCSTASGPSGRQVL